MLGRGRALVAFLVATGLLLIQSAWILAVPPYRGIDEFDHVYRANSVVEGYVRTWGGPVDGRGDLIPVRDRLIEDAREICRSYAYTGPDNCRRVDELRGGLSTVASAASRYNPAPYWLLGLPSLVAEGSNAVYLMRWTAAALCAALVGFAAYVIAGYARSSFPLAGLAIALTPVFAYSTSLPAPNGLEMAAGLSLWAGLLALPHAPPRSTLILIALGAALVAGLRPLGTLWVVLIMGAALATMRYPDLVAAVRRHTRSVMAVLLMTASACVGSILWILTSRTYEIDVIDTVESNRWTPGLRDMPKWALQAIAASPASNDSAPPVVYPLVLLPFLVLVVAGWRHATTRIRAAMAVTALATLVIPYAFTVMTVLQHGSVWQGRYALPLSVGLALLAGHALERSAHPLVLPPWVPLLLAASILVAHVIGVVAVQLREQEFSPLSGDDRWWMLPASVPGLMAAMGAVFLYLAVLRSGRPGSPARSSSRVTVGDDR